MSHFFQPPSPQVVTAFRIPLGETWYVALWGTDTPIGQIKPKVKEETIAEALPAIFPARDGILKFALKANKQGSTEINGVNDRGQSYAYAQVIVGPPLEPQQSGLGGDQQEILSGDTDYSVFPSFIDRVKSGHYDIDGGIFTVEHEDGTKIDLPYSKILSDIRTRATPGTVGGLVGYVRDKRTMKIMPLRYSKTQTPNIAAMVEETETVLVNQDLLMSIPKPFLEILKVYLEVAAASGGMKPGWKATPKSGAGAAARSPMRGIIQGEPPAVKIGSYGQPGNLIARVESGAGGTTYRVESIVLRGEGNAAEIATARAANREMLMRAAETARKQGQSQFRLKGVQANQNFRNWADGLAKSHGVPGSGKDVGGIPGAHGDYEVILDVAKILAGG